MTTHQPEQNNAPLGQTIAVVDLGSNSFHLVLARIIDKDVQILLREKIKVRLAEGLSKDLVLDQPSIERGLKTLQIFAQTLAGFHPDDVKLIGTYTLRSALNAKEFLEKARNILPYPITVVAGQEEARLIYQGVAHSMHFTENRLVIDIGGGSTEFVIGKNFETLALSSRNTGCVSLANLFFTNGKISQKRFKKASLYVEQKLQPIIKQYNQIGWQQCIGTSGTISALTELALANGFTEDHLTPKAMSKIKKLLLSFDHFDELNVEGLNEDRKAVILTGFIILNEAFNCLNIDSIEYCDKALREGVLYEMEERMQHDDIRERSVTSLIRRMSVDEEHAKRVQSTAKFLYKNTYKSWHLKDIPDAKLLLKWASKLHEIGLHINSSGTHKHSAYIIENSAMPGFSQEQLLLLSTLVRFHRKKIRVDDIPEFSLYSNQQVYRLICLFRLAVLLNQKRQPDFLPDFDVYADDEEITLEFDLDWLKGKDLFQANLTSERDKLKKISIDLNHSQVEESLGLNLSN
ncbi:exopolyphosphatase [Thalassotalea aquiviva]|uniref:exopolyphosphatase n=1 Tax=Thalassotalea aquiviva TaxID=3242415 RepID=UPI00352AD74D